MARVKRAGAWWPAYLIALIAGLCYMPFIVAAGNEAFTSSKYTTTTFSWPVDTWIDATSSTTVNEGDTLLQIQGVPNGAGDKALIAFPNFEDSLPSGGQVVYAYLEVTASSSKGGVYPTAGEQFAALRVVADWSASTASYDSAKSGQTWASSGGNTTLINYDDNATYGDSLTGPSTTYDRLLIAEDIVQVGASDTVPQVFRFDITDAVRRWSSGVWINDGIMLVGLGSLTTNDIRIGAVESPTAAYRPKLVVTTIDTTATATQHLGRNRGGIRP